MSGRISLEPAGEKTILEILRGTAPEYLSAPCGGKGTCGKCLVSVTGRVRSLDGGEELELSGETVRACRYVPVGECRVSLPRTGKDEKVRPGVELPRLPGGGQGLGLAVDMGSTTVEAALYDMIEGTPLYVLRQLNAQRGYGADVLSRLENVRRGELSALCEALCSQIFRMAEELCAAAGRQLREIKKAALCGNSIMEHFAAGLDPSSIAVPPFTPLSVFGAVTETGPLAELFPGCEIYLCPCVSGYVGGDLVAGLATVSAGKAAGLTLYLDIGTNGEMALGSGDEWLSCAAAAGPAFEGAELSCGMSGSVGAIDHVRAGAGDIALNVIGGGEAAGICGSGVIDAVAALLKLGLIGKTGRFAKKEALPAHLAERLGSVDGRKAFYLAPGVYLSIDDIRNVQLAKAAIRAGAERLLERAGKRPADIERLIIAGGFGAHINAAAAVAIGLLPQLPPERISYTGNAALAGAALALSGEGRERLCETAALCAYMDLSSDERFGELYLKNVNF